MDIDFLAKMVKELLLDHDKVALPGFGSFVAEMAPSVFSDKGYTINPPYRRLSFRENAGQDDLLVKFFAKSTGISEEESRTVLTAFIAEMREVLNRQKTIIFPELGRLRATKENNYFFVADEDMDIFPDGLGLEPVSLKAHAQVSGEERTGQITEERTAQATEKVAEQKDIESSGATDAAGRDSGSEKEPVPVGEVAAGLGNIDDKEEAGGAGTAVETGNVGELGTAVETGEPRKTVEAGKAGDTFEVGEAGKAEKVGKAKEHGEPAEAVETGEHGDTVGTREIGETAEAGEGAGGEGGRTGSGMGRGVRIALIVAGSLIALAVVALGVFILLAHLCPDFIDSILYTEEELEILRY